MPEATDILPLPHTRTSVHRNQKYVEHNTSIPNHHICRPMGWLRIQQAKDGRESTFRNVALFWSDLWNRRGDSGYHLHSYLVERPRAAARAKKAGARSSWSRSGRAGSAAEETYAEGTTAEGPARLWTSSQVWTRSLPKVACKKEIQDASRETYIMIAAKFIRDGIAGLCMIE